MKKYLCTTLVMLVSLAFHGVSCGAATYRITNLGVPNEDRSQAVDISNNGSILLTGSWGGLDLLTSDGRTTVMQSSSMGCISDNGAYIAGTDESAGKRGFVRYNGQTRYITPLSGYDFVCPESVNDIGQVIGTCYSATSGAYRGFIWEDDSTTDLGTLYDNALQPQDINNAGKVIGYAGYGFTYENETPSACEVFGKDINTRGDIAGSNDFTMHPTAILSGVLTDLGLPSGFTYGSCFGVNDYGVVVGGYAQGGLYTTPFVYENGSMTILPTLGGTQCLAHAINNSGAIVGYSEDSAGIVHAVLWTPVPEPSSILAILTGLAGIGGAVLRRAR